MPTPSAYPTTRAARNRWIAARRGPKNALDPWRPYAWLWEEEPDARGELVPTATIFLTNRECPWRCLMCDLWRNTLDETVPAGAIPAQIRHALCDIGRPADRPAPRQAKLYNAGSFFDPRAIPPGDHADIARCVRGMERVVVECHPALAGPRVAAFRDLLAAEGVGALEVAMGLETAHPVALERLNKGVTVEGFRRAAGELAGQGVALRVFVLVRPPFLSEAEGVEWACRSLDVAFESGAGVVCLIPTRGGNGAIEALAASGGYAPPSLRSLEAAHEYGLRLGRGRVFADLWDIERFGACACSAARAERLAAMNAAQRVLPPVECAVCGGAALG